MASLSSKKKYKVVMGATLSDWIVNLDYLPDRIEILNKNFAVITTGNTVSAFWDGVEELITSHDGNRPSYTYTFDPTVFVNKSGSSLTATLTRDVVLDAVSFVRVETEYPLYYSVTNVSAASSAIVTLDTVERIQVGDVLRITGGVTSGSTLKQSPYDTRYTVVSISGKTITTDVNSTTFGVYSGLSGKLFIEERKVDGILRDYDRVAAPIFQAKYRLTIVQTVFNINSTYTIRIYPNESY